MALLRKQELLSRRCTFAKFADPIPSQSQLNSGEYFQKSLKSDKKPFAIPFHFRTGLNA
jgi:hypothetical protein